MSWDKVKEWLIQIKCKRIEKRKGGTLPFFKSIKNNFNDFHQGGDVCTLNKVRIWSTKMSDKFDFTVDNPELGRVTKKHI